jgi:hypothetical protein
MSWFNRKVYTFRKFEINYDFSWFGSLVFIYINVNSIITKVKKAKLDIIEQLKKIINRKILWFGNKNSWRKNISFAKR